MPQCGHPPTLGSQNSSVLLATQPIKNKKTPHIWCFLSGL
jgi:hypothetical protein